MGCCGLALQTEGQKGRAGGGSSLGNWAGPTSQPEELAGDKALGAKCSPGRWGREGRSVTSGASTSAEARFPAPALPRRSCCKALDKSFYPPGPQMPHLRIKNFKISGKTEALLQSKGDTEPDH